MATQEELIVQFRAETTQMRREIQSMQQQMNDFVNTTSRSSREYRRSFENMGNANSEYSQRLRQLKAEQRAAMTPHIEELKRVKIAYTELGMSMGNYQGSTRDLMREVNALGAAQKKANDALINANRAGMSSILQTIGTMNNMTLMADRLKGNLSSMGNPFYSLSRGALTAVGAFNRFAQSGNAARLALEFVGPNASMKQLNDQIRIINTGLMRLQMTSLATVATFTIFTAAMFKAAKGPDLAEIRKQQQSITDEYNQQYQKRINEVYNFANLFKKVHRETFSGDELKSNLKSQVDLMRGWVNDMKSLGSRIPVELKEELYKMGPEAAGQIRALSQMSQPELDSYVALWREKFALTNEAVKDELGRSRDEANKKIKELQDSLTPLGIAIEKFKKVWAEALKPFVQVWGEFAAGFVNALTKVGEFIKGINEINPAITQVVGMILYLASALAVILTPLAVGIGYFKGLRAVAFAVWAVIGPLLEGLALISPVALGVAAAIAALVLGFRYAYQNIEPFKNAINSALEGIKAFWSVLTNGGSGGDVSILTSLGMTPEAINGIRKFGEDIRSAISGIGEAFNQVKTFGEGLFALFQGNEGKGVGILASLGMTPEAISTIVSFITEAKTVISEGLMAIFSFFQEIGSQIGAFWLANGEQIKQALGNVWTFILGVIQAVMPVIVAVFQVAWPIIKEIVIGTWEAIKSVIQGALDIILGIVKVFSSLFTGDWQGVWDGVKQIWNGALEFLWGYIQLWGAGRILGWLGKFAGDIVKPFVKFWGDIKRVWNDALAEIYVFFGSKLESISSYVGSWGGMIKNFFGDIWQGIVNGVSSKLNGVVTGVKTILDSAVNAVTGFVSRFTEAGGNIIQGLINGISSLAGTVVDKVKSMASSAYEAVTGFFNIHSPSRLMRDVGEFIVMGMIKGLDNMENPAVKAARSVAESVKNEFDTLTEGISLGDISMGSVASPAIPNFSTGYTTPTNASRAAANSNFGQSAIINSEIDANTKNGRGDTYVTVTGSNVDIDEERLVQVLRRAEVLYG